MLGGSKGTSLGEYLENDAEPVEDTDLPVVRLVTFLLQFALLLGLELSFRLFVHPHPPEGVDWRHIVDPGLDKLLEVFDLGGLELCVDVEAVDLVPPDEVGHEVQLSLGKIGTSNNFPGPDEGRVGE